VEGFALSDEPFDYRGEAGPAARIASATSDG